MAGRFRFNRTETWVLTPLAKKAWWASCCLLLVTAADAHDLPAGIQMLPGDPEVQTPAVSHYQALSADQFSTLTQGIDAAQSGDMERARSLQSGLSDPVARKLVLWAMVDAAPERLSFFELDQARRDLWGWPRAAKRQAAAEKLLETSGMSPKATVEWFRGESPASAQGAIALASAYRTLGETGEAKKLIRRFWREKVFEADVQSQMAARFPEYLSAEDNARRADMLLYGQQGPATQAMVAMLTPEDQAIARARMALRANASSANDQVNSLPVGASTTPGLAYERSRYLRGHGLDNLALAQARYLEDKPAPETAGPLWLERRNLINAALRARDYETAYHVAADAGLPPGVDYAEAEFYAGWLALTKLNKPKEADGHFAHIAQVGSSPITQGRAFYWRGRAAEAMGQASAAKAMYERGAAFNTSFYGQLAAEKAGLTELALPRDPTPTAADRARFEGRELVRAARMLQSAGERDLYRSFVLAIDDTLPNAEEYVLLIDMARNNGDQDLSMRVARVAAQRGYVLADRAYPMLSSIIPEAGPEKAFVFSLIRQESNFDPHMRSGPGARGMMQLMPGTAANLARRMGISYSASQLDDPAYNVRLGSAYLDNVIGNFGGSYVMAAAAYNAGPGRLPQWTAYCGDPRGGSTDPVDFIECIPFSETRNYVMRLMETMEVYRARLNGGQAPLTLSQDLKRGSYSYTPSPYTPTPVNGQRPATLPPGAPGTMAPISD
jgi:soluble lytic murein transglycosylase